MISLPSDHAAGLERLAGYFEGFSSLSGTKQKEAITHGIKILNNFDMLKEKPHSKDKAESSPGASMSAMHQLARPVCDLHGVGPKTAAALERMSVSTLEDLLYVLPRCYIDLSRIVPVCRLEPETHAAVIGTVHGTARLQHAGRMRMLELLVNDGSGLIAAKWFRLQQRYAALLKKKYSDGDRVLMTGLVKRFGSRFEMHHPEIELIGDGTDPAQRLCIRPLYPLTEGLAQKTMHRIQQALLRRIPDMVHDYLPEHIRSRYCLEVLSDAFLRVHQPEPDDDLDLLNAGTSRYHRRIVFDEFFLLQTMLALKKRGAAFEPGAALAISEPGFKRLISALPFPLTDAQQRCLDEIRDDMASQAPMHRLLQGDVGCGKTVVSFLAACIAVHNGYQAAIMAPTEILARQHYESIAALGDGTGLRICLLTGARDRSERARHIEEIASGDAQLIIGTHALIQQDVRFGRLGLVIIDEQHKFGVMQRSVFRNKGLRPDMLVMTATPIPRTLGLTLYGDLAVSTIDELPPGRRPVATMLCDESRRHEVYERLRAAAARGRQAFIVYPLVEQSEKLDLLDATRMAARLRQEIFPELRVALLHGRMSSSEKESVMREFSTGQADILVATTVVEVGVDVPNAALMIIEHAERLGLSQLHQLRGRVGRGADDAVCVLMPGYARTEEARRRLAVMEETCDGFKIAEEDFAIRGPGDFLGTRQSGLPDFRVAHLVRDTRILQEARAAAFALVAEDPQLMRPAHQALKHVLAGRWKGRLELAGIG